MNKCYDVCVIGGGAAGMMAGSLLGLAGISSCIVEKNEKLGKKLFITGKGRCNVTNFCDTQELFDNVITNKKFMFSAFNQFSNYDMYALLEEWGLRLKIERGQRVFPESDKSSDVIAAFERKLREGTCDVLLNTKVRSIKKGLVTTDRGNIECRYIIIATGGASYTKTGSTGDGYVFAKSLGNKVADIEGGLVPLVSKEDYVRELMGLSLKNVKVSFYADDKCVYEDFGEMLFTHFGVSGPVILSASSVIRGYIKSKKVKLFIDLKPALDEKELDNRLLRDFESNINRNFSNSLSALLPNKMIDVCVRLSNIDPYKKVNLITKEEREGLLRLIKAFPMTITGTRPIEEAIITCGGVDVNSVNPKTMESKLSKDIFFVGEVLDVDALTGGFNLQIAWSTAHAAASEIINRIKGE